MRVCAIGRLCGTSFAVRSVCRPEGFPQKARIADSLAGAVDMLAGEVFSSFATLKGNDVGDANGSVRWWRSSPPTSERPSRYSRSRPGSSQDGKAVPTWIHIRSESARCTKLLGRRLSPGQREGEAELADLLEIDQVLRAKDGTTARNTDSALGAERRARESRNTSIPPSRPQQTCSLRSLCGAVTIMWRYFSSSAPESSSSLREREVSWRDAPIKSARSC